MAKGLCCILLTLPLLVLCLSQAQAREKETPDQPDSKKEIAEVVQTLNQCQTAVGQKGNESCGAGQETPSPVSQSTLGSKDPLKSEILPNLYLGQLEAAQNLLKNHNAENFDLVISILDHDEQKSLSDLDKAGFHHSVRHLRFIASDGRGGEKEKISSQELSDHFELIAQAVDSLPPGKKVLIHCRNGVNRSASSVLYYLIARRRMKYTDAVKLVMGKRGLQWTSSNRAKIGEIAQKLGLK